MLNISDNAASNAGIFNRFQLTFDTVPNDIVVDVLDDPSPGSCIPGSCSLREAVSLSNSRFGPDRILLPAGNFQLTRTGANEDNNLTGDLDVTDELEIAGTASSQTVIAQTASDRLIHGIGGNLLVIPLTIRNLTLQGGSGVVVGGAIYSVLNNLVIRDAFMLGNRATGRGGALYHAGAGNNGERRMLLERVSFDDNHATNATAANAWGGAVFSAASGGSARYSLIHNCFFTNNRADNGGGALALEASIANGGATTQISRSTFAQNQVTLAGAAAP